MVKYTDPYSIFLDRVYISKAMVQSKTYYLEYNLFFKKDNPISFVANLKRFEPSILHNFPILIYINGLSNYSAVLMSNHFNADCDVKVYVGDIGEFYKISIRIKNADSAYDHFFLNLNIINSRTILNAHENKIVISDTLPEGGILIKPI